MHLIADLTILLCSFVTSLLFVSVDQRRDTTNHDFQLKDLDFSMQILDTVFQPNAYNELNKLIVGNGVMKIIGKKNEWSIF